MSSMAEQEVNQIEESLAFKNELVMIDSIFEGQTPPVKQSMRGS
jgi:hypothetical protein